MQEGSPGSGNRLKYRIDLRMISYWVSNIKFPYLCNNYVEWFLVITNTVIYIFTKAGFPADVYVDDFYGAECPSLADNTFATLQSIPEALPLRLKKIHRRPLRWFAWVSSSIPRILHNVFQSRGFVNYPMSYICGCHASALPSKNCSLCSVNFLSCLLASTLVGFFFLASWTLCVVSLPTLNLN